MADSCRFVSNGQLRLIIRLGHAKSLKIISHLFFTGPVFYPISGLPVRAIFPRICPLSDPYKALNCPVKNKWLFSPSDKHSQHSGITLINNPTTETVSPTPTSATTKAIQLAPSSFCPPQSIVIGVVSVVTDLVSVGG